MFHFRINSNGDSADDVKSQFIELFRLTLALRAHINTMDFVHPRNYQTNDEPSADRQADLDMLHDHMANLARLEHYSMSGAAAAIRQREGL